MKNLQTILTICLISIFSISCENEKEIESFEIESLSDKQKMMKETSILVGKIMINKDVKSALTEKMKEVGKDANIVSFAYLLGDHIGLRKNEIKNLHKRERSNKGNNIFKIALDKEFKENRTNYEIINRTLEKRKSTNNQAKDINSITDQLANLLVTEELQIFYPYDSEFDVSDKSTKESSEFFMSYEPLDGSDTNIGYKFDNYSSEPQIVYDLDNDFLDRNHVYLIVSIDPCDMYGKECGFTDLLPSSPIYSDDSPSHTNTPGEPIEAPALLKDNYNHADILPEDILTTNMPRIMIAGTKWIGFGGTHLKLKIWRGTADGEVIQNSDGTISAKGNKYLISDIRIRRKDCRKKRWVNFNTEFDPDWTMSENSQSIAVFSYHKLGSKASVDLTAKSGFKKEGDKIVPNTESSGTAKIEISENKAILRAKFEVSRRYALATNVGKGTTNETVEFQGIQYNKKWNDRFNYFFQHYYTDLTN